MSIALCEAMLYSHAAQPSTYLSYHSNVEVKSHQTHYTHIDHVKKHQTHQRRQLYPIGSMYGIYANIWGILMVNVTIYGIHGSYGYELA